MTIIQKMRAHDLVIIYAFMRDRQLVYSQADAREKINPYACNCPVIEIKVKE